MKCDKFTTPIKIEIHGIGTIESKDLLLKAEVDEAIAELKARIHELENMPHTDNSAVIELLEKENEDLKNELYAVNTDFAMSQMWRNVDDDFPTAEDGHFWVLWDDGLPDVGYIGAEDDVIETVRDRGEGHSVEWWLPITKATEVK